MSELNQPHQEDPKEPSILEYLTMLLDDWRIVLAFVAAALLLTAGYLLTAVPRYQASGIIQLSNSESATDNTLLRMVNATQPSQVETELAILRSNRVINEAIQKLTLNLVEGVPNVTFDFDVSLRGRTPLSPQLTALRRSISGLTVADHVDEPIGARLSTTGDNSLVVQLGPDQPITVRPGTSFNHRGISFDLSPQGASIDKPLEIQFLPSDLVATHTLDKLMITRVGRGLKGTNLARVSFEHVDRTITRDFVNAVMNSYMAFSLEWRTLRADRTAGFIEKQLATLKNNLSVSEGALQQFVEQEGAVLLPEQGKELIRIGAELEIEQRKTEIQERLLSMVGTTLRQAKLKGEPSALTGDFLFDDPLLGQSIGALNELQMKRESLRTDITENHPSLLRLNEEISAVEEKIHQLVIGSRKRIAKRRQAFSKSMTDVQSKLKTFPDKERQLVALRRTLEVTQELYQFLMTKLEESRIIKASTTTDKRIIDLATTPFSRSKPRWLTVVVTAGFLGLLLGILGVFARRAIDPRVRDEEEANALTRLPMYGAIPDLRALRIGPNDAPFLDSVWEQPKGPAAEAFRTIRTNVEFSQAEEQRIQIIQITSSEAGEGKSTILANLGVALVNAGHKVLIVDLDLRRPSQHRLFGMPRVPGVSECLIGRTESPVKTIEKYQLDLATAGSEPPESQRLLASKRLGVLIEQWRNSYDYVLLDTPPLLVADSLVISRLSDMMLFVVRLRKSRRTNLKLAQNMHQKMSLAKGQVLNSVAAHRRGGYYHYYNGSYYGSSPKKSKREQ